MLLSETFSFLASQWRWCGGDCCCLNPSRIERANEDCTVILWLWRNKASRFRKSSVRHRKFWQSATIGVGGSFPGVDAGVGLSAHFTFHWWSTQHAARMMLLSDKLMSCCAADTNGCFDLRRRAFALDGRVSAEWSRCPGSIARRYRDSMAPLRRSSADWMPAGMGRLSAGLGRRHPVTIRKASLMAGSIRWVWALRHQTGEQYSAVECTKARVAVHNVVAPAPQSEPASRLKSASAISANACEQCQINNSSKCSNCYGPRAFGGRAVHCLQCVLCYMQGWMLEFRCPRQILRKGTLYFTHAIQKLYSLKAS